MNRRHLHLYRKPGAATKRLVVSRRRTALRPLSRRPNSAASQTTTARLPSRPPRIARRSRPPRPPGVSRRSSEHSAWHAMAPRSTEIAEALNREPREVLRVVEQDQPGSRKRRQAKAGVDHAQIKARW